MADDGARSRDVSTQPPHGLLAPRSYGRAVDWVLLTLPDLCSSQPARSLGHGPLPKGPKRTGKCPTLPRGKSVEQSRTSNQLSYLACLPLRNRVYRKLEHLPSSRRRYYPWRFRRTVGTREHASPYVSSQAKHFVLGMPSLVGLPGIEVGSYKAHGRPRKARMPSTRRSYQQHRRQGLTEPGSVSVG